ncbi:histidine phosphatase family protein [Neobacillus sp. LXY-4]|uniref:histidine phosphatase family protein n=1 Tax=Neobacillus sp. LXY-4 TaxID=3379826 RepID=UPI003EE236BE
MRIVFVRHGETNENAAHCYLGHSDPPLNDHGGKQIIDSSLQLLQDDTNEKFTSIYCSDLRRAQETAQIIGDFLNLIPVPTFSLRELNFGDWEGLTYEEILGQNPVELNAWITDPYTVAPPKGETLAILGARFDKWFNQVLDQIDTNERIIIVSHGGPIRWFCSKWLLGDEKQFWIVEGVKHGAGLEVQYDKHTGEFTRITPNK